MNPNEKAGVFALICAAYLLWYFITQSRNSRDKLKNYQVYVTWFGKDYYMNVPAQDYVNEVIQWCKENLGIPSGVKMPRIIIYEEKNGNRLGAYAPSTNEIFLYLPMHSCLLELTNTVIHEYDHFLKLSGNKGQRRYSQIMDKSGYSKHPYEISARATAKLDFLCLQELLERGLVVKK